MANSFLFQIADCRFQIALEISDWILDGASAIAGFLPVHRPKSGRDTHSATAKRPSRNLKNLKSEICNLKSQQHSKGRWGGKGTATGGAQNEPGRRGYMSRKIELVLRRAASWRSRCSAFSRASSQSLHRTANGSARRRFSAIS
jgi:hypothetical protein